MSLISQVSRYTYICIKLVYTFLIYLSMYFILFLFFICAKNKQRFYRLLSHLYHIRSYTLSLLCLSAHLMCLYIYTIIMYIIHYSLSQSIVFPSTTLITGFIEIKLSTDSSNRLLANTRKSAFLPTTNCPIVCSS